MIPQQQQHREAVATAFSPLFPVRPENLRPTALPPPQSNTSTAPNPPASTQRRPLWGGFAAELQRQPQPRLAAPIQQPVPPAPEAEPRPELPPPASFAPPQSRTIQPDYSDPHGLRPFLTETLDLFQPGLTANFRTRKYHAFLDDEVLRRVADILPQQCDFPQEQLAVPPSRRYSAPYVPVRLAVSKRRSERKPQPQTEDRVTVHVSVRCDRVRDKLIRVRTRRAGTVRDLKREIACKLRLEAHDLKLCRGEIPLNENSSLAAAGLRNNSGVTLVDDFAEEMVDRRPSSDVSMSEPSTSRGTQPTTIQDDELMSDAVEILPRLTKSGYRTKPEFSALTRMCEEDLSRVSRFTVYNRHGKIEFEGETDLRGVDLDSAVCINPREVVVYPDEDMRPGVGEGLNRSAIVWLYMCFPKQGGEDEDSRKRYVRKLKFASVKQNAEFLGYDEIDGVWTFRVSHF